MNEVAKYEIKLISKDDNYTKYNIIGLKEVFYKSIKLDQNDDKCTTDNFLRFSGACGLLRNSEYKGYCNLCMVYHKNKPDEFPKPSYSVEFHPLYNELGQMILIKYNYDDIFTVIDNGIKNYKTDELNDCILTFWNNGIFNEFN